MSQIVADREIKEAVQEAYGKIARRYVEEPGRASCCGPNEPRVLDQPKVLGEQSKSGGCSEPSGLSDASDCCGPTEVALEATASKLYSVEELADLPESVTDMSLGCGNPTAIAELQRGEVVLDLGSGGGIDCFLAAEQVGPQGQVIGLDMTPDMIRLARRNARKMGVQNVDFRYGEMEEIPLPDRSVDVIISNCVINLSPDKDAVFGEAFRVLRPGGRMSVSDIVVNSELPQPVRARLDAWAGCIAGALDETDYLARIRTAGFEGVEIQSRDYLEFDDGAGWEDVQALLDEVGLAPADLEHKVASIKVTAARPA